MYFHFYGNETDTLITGRLYPMPFANGGPAGPRWWGSVPQLPPIDLLQPLGTEVFDALAELNVGFSFAFHACHG